MSSLITIIDTNSAYTSSQAGFKVVVTNHEDDSVVLNGSQAVSYLMNNIFSGFTNNNNLSQNSGVLPPGVRIIGENYVVFERPPSYQNVFYNTEKVSSDMSDSNTHLFRIPVPWQVYIATFDSNYYLTAVSMFFSPTSLMSKDQPLYLAPLPNFYTNGSLCRPMFSSMEDIERYPKDLSGVIASAYDWIWNNGTNNDLNEAMVHINIQLISKNRSLINETIFKNVSSEVYDSIFHVPYISYYHSAQVMAIFRSWEQISLEEVVNLKWSSSSKELHFPQNYYSPNGYDVTQHPDYYDWLSEWAFDYYDGESSENIEYMIENGEYDGDAYHDYVTSSGKVEVKPIQYNPLTCQEILNYYSVSNNYFASLKSKFNGFVTSAFQAASKASKV